MELIFNDILLSREFFDRLRKDWVPVLVPCRYLHASRWELFSFKIDTEVFFSFRLTGTTSWLWRLWTTNPGRSATSRRPPTRLRYNTCPHTTLLDQLPRIFFFNLHNCFPCMLCLPLCPLLDIIPHGSIYPELMTYRTFRRPRIDNAFSRKI
jgi:hypothetical protein